MNKPLVDNSDLASDGTKKHLDQLVEFLFNDSRISLKGGMGDIYNEASDYFEKSFLEKALAENDRNQKKVAELLGFHRNTLIIKMGKYGLKNRKGDVPKVATRY